MSIIEYLEGKIIIDNGVLHTEIIPGQGGKISSLYITGKKCELLFQPPHSDYGIPGHGAAFAEYAAAGFDDAFPNIDAEEFTFEGNIIKYNDHGDIWTTPMEAYLKKDSAVVHTENSVYSFKKSIRLDENKLIVEYTIKNISDRVFPCFYTMHCLFRCTEDMRITFPDEVTTVENAYPSERLGAVGTLHSFPVTESSTDLSRVRRADSGKYEKFYAQGRIINGSCGLYYPSDGIRVRVNWDTVNLPYLGFWVTEGGFRSDYNCAIEPSSGYYDSVSRAVKNNKLWYMKPGEEKRFEICITVDV